MEKKIKRPPDLYQSGPIYKEVFLTSFTIKWCAKVSV